METVKISTPDGNLPSVTRPVEGVHYTVELATPVAGDLIRVRFGKSEAFTEKGPDQAPPAPLPRVLSKTSFQDYAVSQLGGGLTGMARFTAIMDATRDSASGAVRFAFERYEAAERFEKTNTDTLTEVMAADNTAGHITDAERLAILDNWPTA